MEKFSKEKIDKIANVVGAEKVEWDTDHYRLKVASKESRRLLILEIYPNTPLGRKTGAMIVVYAGGAHLQLHNCSGFVTSDELGEVTFVSETGEQISGIVVERDAACSLYSNINRELISSDFTKFGVEVMLSGVALSLAEDILQKDDSENEE
ncbi:MAG: hypothetical protein GF310_11075 [candidate division Zixibacteria bacterium]|nr:hypothetical protein [candidate division Zixibacteria bacterium]